MMASRPCAELPDELWFKILLDEIRVELNGKQIRKVARVARVFRDAAAAHVDLMPAPDCMCPACIAFAHFEWEDPVLPLWVD